MSIPKFKNNGELPEGEHLASLEEIALTFGSYNERREELMNGLRKACINLGASGVKTLWLNGSFVTNKKEPNDIDGCWEYNNTVNVNMLDPIFLGSRVQMKKKYGLDFFIANWIEAKGNLPFPKFFQKNREGDPKGIIIVKLGGRS